MHAMQQSKEPDSMNNEKVRRGMISTYYFASVSLFLDRGRDICFL